MPQPKPAALEWPNYTPPVADGVLDAGTYWRAEPALRLVQAPELLRWEVRSLTAPDGSQHVVEVPVYGPTPFRRNRLKRKWRGRRLY
jgi:hypothetical protein